MATRIVKDDRSNTYEVRCDKCGSVASGVRSKSLASQYKNEHSREKHSQYRNG